MTANEEELSYEDRKKWFRYHIDNSKVNEENAWKQMNEMIRMKIKKDLEEEKEKENEYYYPEGVLPIKQVPSRK